MNTGNSYDETARQAVSPEIKGFTVQSVNENLWEADLTVPESGGTGTPVLLGGWQKLLCVKGSGCNEASFS